MASAFEVPSKGRAPSDRPAFAKARGDMPDALRMCLGGACILAFWNHAPLADLSDRNILETSTAGSWTTQVLFLVLGFSMAAALRQLGIEKLRPLLTWPLIALASWMGLTLLTSVEPLLSIRRILLFVIVTMIAAGIPVVMRSVRQFALTLAIVAMIIVISSYLAVAFLPQLAIHSADFDLLNEPEHEGLWRGIFAHKNEAGGAMALMILTGLFVASALSRVWGITIVLLAAVFLAAANSKSVTALLPFIVLAPSLCSLVRNGWLRAAILIGPTTAVSLFSLGSVFFPPIRDGLVGILPDTSFTGRTEIWEFAASHIVERPLFGWGFGAFWGTERTKFGTSDALSWVTKTSQAHNTYLDVCLLIGLPGLLMVLAAFVVAPLRDLQRIAPAGRIDPMTLYFVRLWLLALTGGSFESVLFTPSSSICCMFMLAIFGLRYRASYRTVPG
ncbi:O-antigen ligase family protein [Methylobacterium gnaphalii]|uniref:Exopolysaccharide biosynthesis protein n=1 Tax=Methylobacterium gnaphalii TaxID=1010610 RepID=A0A512JFU4_9HYPH|nr:O-antigen ligase [Methylobacterium gnaphalii]GEP08815.1 exopolysaccharide biosynthesis protein [Methylobacterium gnaphalii]GLS47581.1 exopolysaccharide biosynthesis protein [Methylobacterium gnaphalii]